VTERFADPIDQAAATAYDELERSIAAILSHKPAVRPFTGRCYHCDDDVSSPKRFCDPDCADDYERERSSFSFNR